MMIKSGLKDTLLIAMPQLDDPYFSGTVIYLCEHNEDGAMGVIINRPLNVYLGDLLTKAAVSFEHQIPGLSNPLLYGGPIDIEHGFILHNFSGKLDRETSIPVSHEIALTSLRFILDEIGAGQGPNHFLVTLGYAVWGAGQLEHELAANAWLNSPADQTILFHTPYDQRLEHACAYIGVDLAMLSQETGHA